MIDVSRFDAYADLPADIRGRLVHNDSLFTSPAWTSALTLSNPSIHVEWWLASYDTGVSAIPVHVLPGPPSRTTYDVAAVFGGELPARGGELSSRTHILIGTRNGQGNGFVRSGDENLPAELALLQRILDFHAQHVIGMLYIDQSLALALRELDRSPHSARLIDAAARITISDSLDHTISEIDGRRRRMKIRREMRTAAASEPVTVIETPSQIEELAPILAPLARAVNERHGQTTTDEQMSSYVRSIARSGLQPALFVGGPLARPASFSIAITDAKTLSIRTCGFDYERLGANGPLEYAKVVVYEPARYVDAAAIRVLDLGTGTLHAKTLRGAEVVPLYGAMWLPADFEAVSSRGGEALLMSRLLETTPRLQQVDTAAWGIE